MHIVVSYDVTSDRRRRRIQRALAEWLEHVQKSVFEGELAGPREYEAMVETLEALIDPKLDSVRIYRICARCRPAIELIGTGRSIEPDVRTSDLFF